MPEYIRQGAKRVLVKHAILHCAAVPTGWHLGRTGGQMRAAIDGWHKERGWAGIGYHYLITPTGEVVLGRALTKVGAHARGMNAGTLGILMIESKGITEVGAFADYFTERQKQAVVQINKHHGISRVSGHNDHAPTLCPGFKVNQLDFLPKSSASQAWQRIGQIIAKPQRSSAGGTK